METKVLEINNDNILSFVFNDAAKKYIVRNFSTKPVEVSLDENFAASIVACIGVKRSLIFNFPSFVDKVFIRSIEEETSGKISITQFLF